MTQVGKAVKQTYQCRNCVHWSGDGLAKFARCVARGERRHRASCCGNGHRRRDINRREDRLTGPGRRGKEKP